MLRDKEFEIEGARIRALSPKEYFLEFWTPTLGAADALQCWETKERQQRIDLNFQVMPDIEPYQSMATGEMITSRSQHREHLKIHRLNEIGNEMPYIERRAAEIQRERARADDNLRVERIKESVYRHLGS